MGASSWTAPVLANYLFGLFRVKMVSRIVFKTIFTVSAGLSGSVRFLVASSRGSVGLDRFSLSQTKAEPGYLYSVSVLLSHVVPPVASIFIVSSVSFLIFSWYT